MDWIQATTLVYQAIELSSWAVFERKQSVIAISELKELLDEEIVSSWKADEISSEILRVQVAIAEESGTWLLSFGQGFLPN